jgi:lipopolysaccharide transport system ATP-binding protein
VASLLEVGTGFHPELSGRENVYMNGTILGMTKKHIDERFDRIVEFSGVERFIDTPIKRYSSGMKVRLAFSVAAHLEPEILIIDEVLAVGDAEFQRRCLGKMSEVARGGRTVLFVSHQMEAVQRLCTRCIWIDAGKVVADAAPEVVVPRYLGTQAEGISHRYRVPDPGPPGPVWLAEAVVAGADGREGQPVLYGEPVEIRMRWQCREGQPGAFYFVRVTDGQGRQLFTVNTRGRIEPVEGTMELRCRFDHSMFLPGTYSVTLGCFRSPNQFVHEAHHAIGIAVLEAAYPGVDSNVAVRSLFDPRPSWHVG